MHLSRQKGSAVFSSSEKHEMKVPEAGTESWVSLLQLWEASGAVKVLLYVWVCWYWFGWDWFEFILLSLQPGFK